MPTTPDPYNLMDYPGRFFSQCHPRRLEAVARLHGLHSPSLDNCRVLELGCGDGIHLMSVACELPGSHCVGIDLAEAGIVRGRQLLAETGIANVRLEQRNILDVGADFGEFDYIVAHGIYSWVPESVRDKLLAICRAHLAQNGVAFVSYNALPGGHLRRMVDEMLAWRVRHVASPGERAGLAREFAGTLADWSGGGKRLYGSILASEARRLAGMRDFSLYHDNLASINTPVFFSQFMAHAERHGLAYLGDAQVADMDLHLLSPATLEAIGDMATNRIEWEQYVDFAEGTAFRQTLLCRSEVVVKESGEENLDQLYVAGKLSWAEGADLQGPGEVAFVSDTGISVTLNIPLLKQALVCLDRAWPSSLSLQDWLRQLHDRGAVGDVDAAKTLLRTLALRGRGAGLLEIWATPLRATAEVALYPKVSAIARWEAGRDGRVTSLRGQPLEFDDPFSRRLLQLLDGTRTRAALCEVLWATAEAENLPLPAPLANSPHPREDLPAVVDYLLQGLVRMALLLE